MKKLITLINNLRYLSRYNLKEMAIQCQRMDYSLDNIRYEIESDLKEMKRVKIHGQEETLDKILNSDCSISRFGDGEIMLAFGEDIPCQNYSPEVGRKLQEALSSKNEKLLIGIPNLYQSLAYTTLERRRYDREILGHYTPLILKLLHEDKEYYTPSFASYICAGIKKEEDVQTFENLFNKIRQLWQGKDIAIVCGDRVFNYLQNNIYDNASSIEYIYAPTNHAFSEYNSILERVKKVDKSKMIILILGPTATILASDLTDIGYRALDLGHLGKEYDAFIRRIEGTPKNLKKFFNPE